MGETSEHEVIKETKYYGGEKTKTNQTIQINKKSITYFVLFFVLLG